MFSPVLTREQVKLSGSALDCSQLTVVPCANCADCPGTRKTRHACLGCLLVSYCSPECQAQDWPSHKVFCRQTDLDSDDAVECQGHISNVTVQQDVQKKSMGMHPDAGAREKHQNTISSCSKETAPQQNLRHKSNKKKEFAVEMQSFEQRKGQTNYCNQGTFVGCHSQPKAPPNPIKTSTRAKERAQKPIPHISTEYHHVQKNADVIFSPSTSRPYTSATGTMRMRMSRRSEAMPATDHFNWHANEGSTAGKSSSAGDSKFDALFACSGDLRNLLLSLNSMPPDHKGVVNIYLNDVDPQVCIRNYVILQLLEWHGEDAIDFAIHLWHSAYLTREMATCAGVLILRLIQRVLESDSKNAHGRIRTSFGRETWACLWDMLRVHAKYTTTGESPDWSTDESEFLMSWNPDGYGSALHQQKIQEQLRNLQKMLVLKSRNPQPAPTQAQLRATAPTSSLYESIPVGVRHIQARRLWEATRVLLPFGAARAEFMCPNLLAFDGYGYAPPHDPVAGYEVSAVLRFGRSQAGVAANDVYGALYFFLRHHLREFARRLKAMRITIYMHDLDACDMAVTLLNSRLRFDRIDIGRIGEYDGLRPRIGISRALELFRPLLKKTSSSTLTALFANWHETVDVYKESKINDNLVSALSKAAAKWPVQSTTVCQLRTPPTAHVAAASDPRMLNKAGVEAGAAPVASAMPANNSKSISKSKSKAFYRDEQVKAAPAETKVPVQIAISSLMSKARNLVYLLGNATHLILDTLPAFSSYFCSNHDLELFSTRRLVHKALPPRIGVAVTARQEDTPTCRSLTAYSRHNSCSYLERWCEWGYTDATPNFRNSLLNAFDGDDAESENICGSSCAESGSTNSCPEDNDDHYAALQAPALRALTLHSRPWVQSKFIHLLMYFQMARLRKQLIFDRESKPSEETIISAAHAMHYRETKLKAYFDLEKQHQQQNMEQQQQQHQQIQQQQQQQQLQKQNRSAGLERAAPDAKAQKPDNLPSFAAKTIANAEGNKKVHILCAPAQERQHLTKRQIRQQKLLQQKMDEAVASNLELMDGGNSQKEAKKKSKSFSKHS